MLGGTVLPGSGDLTATVYQGRFRRQCVAVTASMCTADLHADQQVGGIVRCKVIPVAGHADRTARIA